MDQQNWLHEQIETACRNAKKRGLGGDRFGLELYTSGGRIFDGSVAVPTGDLKTRQTKVVNYPSFVGPIIIRLNDAHHVFENAACEEPEGTLVKTPERMAAAI